MDMEVLHGVALLLIIHKSGQNRSLSETQQLLGTCKHTYTPYTHRAGMYNLTYDFMTLQINLPWPTGSEPHPRIHLIVAIADIFLGS